MVEKRLERKRSSRSAVQFANKDNAISHCSCHGELAVQKLANGHVLEAQRAINRDPARTLHNRNHIVDNQHAPVKVRLRTAAIDQQQQRVWGGGLRSRQV